MSTGDKPTTRRRFLEIGRDVGIGLGVGALLSPHAGCTNSSAKGEDPAANGASPKQPNIVLFVIDDLGVSDCGVCGSVYYHTPAMDRIAREGVRFSQSYSPSPLCSSSRAAIHTGKYPHRLGITGAIDCRAGCAQVDTPKLAAIAAAWQKVVTPSYLTQLPLGERTIAEYLRDAGYVTAHIGKWHLGGGEYSAGAQGFEHVVGGGADPAPVSHFSPYGLEGLADGPPGEYIADRLTNESESFIRQYAGAPFFLSLAHFGVHVPLEAPSDLVADYAAWRDPENAQRNPVYAAMIEKVDQSLGRVMDTLAELGLTDDTLLIVTSDNGGLMQTLPDSFLRRVTSNGPFRAGKAEIYEGGIRVPLFVGWGSRVQAGRVSDVPVSGMDILSTVLDVAGLQPAPVDGRSFRPQIESQAAADDRSLVWHFPHYIPIRQSPSLAIDEIALASLPATAIRRGNYKLVRFYGEGATTSDAADELYDLVRDPGETLNIASLYPDLVADLGARLVSNLAETGALTPVANPGYRERLDGWRVVRECTPRMAGGFLRLTATGADPQIVSQVLVIGESAIVRVRLRSVRRTTIQVFYSTRSTPVFDGAMSTYTMLAAGGSFSEMEFPVPVAPGAPVKWLRLDPGTSDDIVDIDEIAVVAASDPSRTLYQWKFDDVSGLEYGGSWFANTDAFVSLGPGSLQIDLAGSAPSITSPPLTLFGPLEVELRLRSTGAGGLRLGWSLSPAFALVSSKSVGFEVTHDGAWHEYTVTVDETSDDPVQRFSLSLGNAKGSAEIDYIRVFDNRRSLVEIWDFGPGEVAA